MASNSSSNATIYFGYGSNLWLHQMDQRCPTSKYLGVARLNGYKWIINDRGYANVVEVEHANLAHPSIPVTHGDTEDLQQEQSHSYENVVFGLVYSLEASDEKRLDRNEGVPIAYTKEGLKTDFWSSKNGSWVDITKKPTKSEKMLVYIDRNRTSEDVPKKEYIYRMNRGIEDAVKMGVPKKYVEDVMRRFIPEDGIEDRKSMETFARKQAVEFRDESGVFGAEDGHGR
ncbi:hypothetical protein BDV96DRAFT_496540 [Lophiotrema nucula]|uniref:gamma-glutamylcyclotransferase n=1 Tax=Lophiotrema nucula TaxID=690887 RepID=A0A6A5Z1T8_9PLEO|nr:hypothetical protein BDV96DRAFT_496540 [Lophiotrema nucula]